MGRFPSNFDGNPEMPKRASSTVKRPHTQVLVMVMAIKPVDHYRKLDSIVKMAPWTYVVAMWNVRNMPNNIGN